MQKESLFDNVRRGLLPPDVEENLRKYGQLRRQTLGILRKRGYSSPGTAALPEDLELALLELCGLIGALAKRELVEK